MTDDQPKYDIAISFLVADEKIASSLNAGLGDLKVFFYPHKQEELIGTNGMESMRAPFIGARVNVILFREKYGKTPWTGVELAAIQDSCLRTGYRSLVFVQLDKKDVKPEWLPSTHIRCLLDDFTIEQLIGAIKSKVQENGGTIRRPNARTEALRVQEEASYLADRDRLMRDSTWIGELRRCVDDTIIEIGRIVSELNTKNKLNIGFGKGQGGVTILRSGFVSMSVGWQQTIANYVGDSPPYECHLWAAEYSGTLPLQGENAWYVEPPKRLKLNKFKVDVAQDRGLVWRIDGTKKNIAASEMADHIVCLFLDLISRANEGKIERSHI